MWTTIINHLDDYWWLWWFVIPSDFDDRYRSIETSSFASFSNKLHENTLDETTVPTTHLKLRKYNFFMRSSYDDHNRRWWWPIDATSPMMSVTRTDDNGRTSSICERSSTQKALKGNNYCYVNHRSITKNK